MCQKCIKGKPGITAAKEKGARGWLSHASCREEVVKGGVSWASIIPIHKKFPSGTSCSDDFLSFKGYILCRHGDPQSWRLSLNARPASSEEGRREGIPLGDTCAASFLRVKKK